MKKRTLAIVLSLIMCFAVVAYGCTPAETTPSDSTAPSESTEQGGTEPSESAEQGGSDATESGDIYSKLPDLALSGITSPDLADRSDVEKAWPKTPASEDTIVIGWTEINQASDWFVGVKEGAEQRAEELGFQLQFLVAEDDPQTQSQHVDTFISQGVDIIVLDPVNSSAPVNDINRAVEAGIPVVCIGTVPEDCQALTTLTANPFLNGYECGKVIGAQYDASEDIISTAILGVMGSSTSESRTCGMMAGILEQRMEAKGSAYASQEDAWLAGYNMFQDLKTGGKAENADAGFYVNGFGVGEWTVEGGLTAAEDLITANPDMNLILAENDFMAAGAYSALETAGMVDQVKIGAAADGTRVGLDMIKAGQLICTGPNSGQAQGAWAIDFINMIFNEGADPSNLPLGSYFESYAITAENVEEIYDPNLVFFKVGEFEFPASIPEIKGEA